MKKETNAMQEVLQIKEEAWKEVEKLPLDQAIRERLRSSEETVIRLGFARRILPQGRSIKSH